MFGFSSMPSSDDPLLVQLAEDLVQRLRRHVVAALDRVVAVHQHLGLDDRHEAGLLARAPRSAPSACALTRRQ